MDTLTVGDLWNREVFTETGQRLGRVEAIGMARDRVPRRVGIRSRQRGAALRFFPAGRFGLADGRLVFRSEPG
jgi:hypothetical protein